MQRISQGCCSVVPTVCDGDANSRQSASDIKAPLHKLIEECVRDDGQRH